MIQRSTDFQKGFEGAYNIKPCTEHFKAHEGYATPFRKERFLN